MTVTFHRAEIHRVRVLCCGVLIAMSFAGYSLPAQDPGSPPPDEMEGPPPGPPPSINVDKVMAHMTKRYNLTDAEAVAIRSILVEEKQKQDALVKSSSSSSREDTFQSMNALHREETTKIEAVLTDEQRSMYLKDEQRASRRRDDESGVGDGPPPPPPGNSGPPPGGSDGGPPQF